MQQGLVHIYCGDGKGKTTAATGLAVRCAGGDGNVLWFQFLKRDISGERSGLAQLKHVTMLSGYDKMKFTFQMTQEEKQQAAGFYREKIEQIALCIQENDYDMLVLDETFGAISSGLVDEEQIVKLLTNRPKGLEVVMTGRNPSEQLLEMADYISEIKKVRHPYDKGIAARKKIEF